MKSRRGRLIVAGVIACSAMLIPGTAFAGINDDHYSYEGADYAYSYKTTRKMQVADNENDGHWVYSDYYLSGSNTKRQLENKSGSGTDVFRSVTAKPYKLRVVEAIPILPNQYGAWDYPDDYTF